MLPKLTTIQFLREIETDGHSPMQFICSDQFIYYLKYRSGKSYDQNELVFLIYEVLCSVLLNRLNIPTPQIALATLKGNYTDQFKVNKRYAKEGKICFASKEVPNSQLVMDISVVESHAAFLQILNPLDLIRIAIFDLWVDNTDRGKKLISGGHNYNLLLKDNYTQSSIKHQIMAFDHAFTFGGQKSIVSFSDKMPLSSSNKLPNSAYFDSIIRFIPKDKAIQTLFDFIRKCQNLDISPILLELESILPNEWYAINNLNQKIYDFLISPQRWKQIEQVMLKTLQK